MKKKCSAGFQTCKIMMVRFYRKKIQEVNQDEE